MTDFQEMEWISESNGSVKSPGRGKAEIPRFAQPTIELS